MTEEFGLTFESPLVIFAALKHLEIGYLPAGVRMAERIGNHVSYPIIMK